MSGTARSDAAPRPVATQRRIPALAEDASNRRRKAQAGETERGPGPAAAAPAALPSLLDNRAGLRAAIVAVTVLGPCRALDPQGQGPP